MSETRCCPLKKGDLAGMYAASSCTHRPGDAVRFATWHVARTRMLGKKRPGNDIRRLGELGLRKGPHRLSGGLYRGLGVRYEGEETNGPMRTQTLDE